MHNQQQQQQHGHRVAQTHARLVQSACTDAEIVRLALKAGVQLPPPSEGPVERRKLCLWLAQKYEGDKAAAAAATLYGRNRSGDFATAHMGALAKAASQAESAAMEKETTDLIEAAKADNEDEVKRLLIGRGANINKIVDKEGNKTALRAAISSGHFRIVWKLLKAGADVNQANQRGETPLMLAASEPGDHVEMIKTILKYAETAPTELKLQPNQHGEYDQLTALGLASVNGNEHVVKRLLKALAGMNSQEAIARVAETALLEFVRYDKMPSKNIVNLLLQQEGVDPNFVMKRIVEDLIRGLDLMGKNPREAVTKALLILILNSSKRADPTSILSDAIQVSMNETTKPLLFDIVLSHNPDLKSPLPGSGSQNTALIKAAPFPSRLRKLLDAGADPNTPNAEGITPLHATAMSQSPQSAKELIDRGAKIGALDSKGETPLHLALQSMDYDAAEVAKLLLAAGADPNMPDAQGRLPLALVKANKRAASRQGQSRVRARDVDFTSLERALLAAGAKKVTLRSKVTKAFKKLVDGDKKNKK